METPAPAALWHEFLGLHAASAPLSSPPSLHGATVLITGAGGSIGSAVALAVAAGDARAIVCVDLAENGLFALQQQLARVPFMPGRASFHLGSVSDPAFMAEVLRGTRPDIVVHAAAVKHVPFAEANPIVAAQTNVLGTATVCEQAALARVRRFVHLSTDKAVDPIGVLGATKRVAERLVMLPWSSMLVTAVRLPNVLGSSGSVGPLFLQQIERREPLTVTHPDATRFFLSLDRTVALLLQAMSLDGSAFVTAETGPARRIVELARFLYRRCTGDLTEAVPMRFTGLRPGDKLHERMLSANETATSIAGTELLSIAGEGHPTGSAPTSVLTGLQRAIAARDRVLLSEILREAAPEYVPQSSGPALDHETRAEALL